METLTDIYLRYEIGDIYPDQMPEYAMNLLQTGYENEYLVELASMTKPLKSEVDEIVCKALCISLNQLITNHEKAEIAINWYENGKINLERLTDFFQEHNNIFHFPELLPRIYGIAWARRENGESLGDYETLCWALDEIKKELSKVLQGRNKYETHLITSKKAIS